MKNTNNTHTKWQGIYRQFTEIQDVQLHYRSRHCKLNGNTAFQFGMKEMDKYHVGKGVGKRILKYTVGGSINLLGKQFVTFKM